jgi:hypothetical protein
MRGRERQGEKESEIKRGKGIGRDTEIEIWRGR